MVKLKRVYEGADRDDGYRVLVDRLWPRGVSKEKAQLDLWLKEIAPSDSLRKWFGHDPGKWSGFKERYRKELKEKNDLIEQLRALIEKHKTVTLLYAARDTQHNEAVVLSEILG